MTPIAQPCTCEPMMWLYFVFVQSVFVFVGQTLATAENLKALLQLPWTNQPISLAVHRCGCTS
jgi:hypothetical protein